MSNFIFSISALFARQFAPSTFEQANAAAVLRVLRWFAVALAVAAALVIALAWLALQLGLAAYHATEGAPQGYEQYMEPIGPEPALEPSLEQLAAWSESVAIEWPTAIAAESVTDWAGLTVAQLRSEAAARGLSIRQGGKVLRKAELIAAMA